MQASNRAGAYLRSSLGGVLFDLVSSFQFLRPFLRVVLKEVIYLLQHTNGTPMGVGWVSKYLKKFCTTQVSDRKQQLSCYTILDRSTRLLLLLLLSVVMKLVEKIC